MAETTKPRTKRPVAKKPQTLAEIGRAAADEAQREAITALGREVGWNLSEMARRFELGGSSNMLKTIRRLGLESLYLAERPARE